MTPETQLRDDLRDLVAGQPFIPDIEMAVQRGRRLRRRGQAIRGVAVLSLVAGITTVAVALNPRPPTVALHKPVVPPSSAHVVPAPSAQAIMARTVAAMTTGHPLYRIVDSEGQETFDGIHGATEVTDLGNGTPVWIQATRRNGSGKFDVRVIDYQKRVWADLTVAVVRFATGDKLADEFRHGDFTVVATAVVDGQLSDKLVPTGQSSLGWTWISRATSLPLSAEYDGVTSTYQWLSSIDPSSMWPAIPAGFRQVQATPDLLDHH